MSEPQDGGATASLCATCGTVLSEKGVCPLCVETELAEETVAFGDEVTIAGDAASLAQDAPTVISSDLPTQASDTAARSASSGTLSRVAHYKILKPLGAGGMGAVYLAEDEKMERPVALKVMSRHQAPSQKAGMRFEQEAWIAGKLDHPNLVKVYERGTWEELSFYSMEVVDGGSLHDVVENMRRDGRDETWDLEFGTSQYIHWAIRQIVVSARALDYAHNKGVTHRDVKPMNLLLSREQETVKIADFGLAIDAEVTRMTTAGAVLGTLMFMAPEQLLGKADAIGPATDIYALGVTLFELLTLEMPYSGKTQQMYVNDVLKSEARRASTLNQRISRDLETVLMKTLEKAPQDRYPSAAAFADDLENILFLRPIQVRPSGVVSRATKWARRKPIEAVLVITLALGIPLVGILGLGAVRRGRAERRAKVEQLLEESRWFEERYRYRQALGVAEKLVELEPRNVEALRARATAAFELSVEIGGEAESDRLRETALADVDTIVARLPRRAWPQALKAYMLRELARTTDDDENRTRLEADAEDAERQGASLRGPRMSDEELRFTAWRAFSSGDHERAIELLDELVVRHPDESSAIATRAAVYDALGNKEAAYYEMRLAAGINPDRSKVYFDLAKLSAERGRFEDAERYVERGLELAPGASLGLEAKANVMNQRGVRYAIDGDRDRAEAAFDSAEQAGIAAIGSNPDLLWARLNLATTILEQNRLLEESSPELIRRAIEEQDQLLERWETPPVAGLERQVYVAAVVNRCDASIQLGDLDQAERNCLDVTRALPKNAIGFYNLAGVYALMGRPDPALSALRKDLELGDTDWEYLAADPWFDSLRSDPRFETLLADMKRLAEES